MATNLPSPPAIPTPFAANGNKNTIPDTSATFGAASYAEGFPPETSIPVSNGGIPPSREDMNGVLNVATFPHYFFQVGGFYTYDDSVASKINGYPNGAILDWYTSSGGARKLRSTVANNMHNFVTSPGVIGSYWEDVTPVAGGRKMFEFFWSFSTDTPGDALRLNGQILTGCNVSTSPYYAFYLKGKELAAAGKIAAKTMSQYAQEIASYGECNAFVFDQDNSGVAVVGNMRIPTIRNFIQAGTPGGIHSAGLPNITGTIWGERTTDSSWNVVSGAFFKDTAGGSANPGKSATDYDNVNVGFNASRCNSVYGGAATVQPASVELVPYIQYRDGNSIYAGSSGIITSAQVTSMASEIANSAVASAASNYLPASGEWEANTSSGGNGATLTFSNNGAKVGKLTTTILPVTSTPYSMGVGTAAYYIAYDSDSAISGAFVYDSATSQWSSAVTSYDGSAWTSVSSDASYAPWFAVSFDANTGAVSGSMGDNIAADMWIFSGTNGAVNVSSAYTDENGDHDNSVSITLAGGTSGGSVVSSGSYDIYDELHRLNGGYAYTLDSTTTSAAISVLSGGSYLEFTSPLSSLVVASVVRTVRDSYLQFTLAAGGSVLLSGTSGFDGEITLEGGKSYLVGIMNGIRAIQEIASA